MVMDESNGDARTIAPLCFGWANYIRRFQEANRVDSVGGVPVVILKVGTVEDS